MAIGGHGKVFRDPRTALATFRIWIEVLTGHGWTNASFTNTTEVRVDEKGNYELEAIVGDARRRASIKAIRLYLEGLEGVLCWYREVDLEYMYLYQEGRKPSRQFHYDIMMFGPDVHREGLQPGASSDECFHPRLAVDLLGLIMCNASVPMANATVIIAANRTSEGPLVKNAGATDDKGVFQDAVVFDDETLRMNEIQNVLLMFANGCDNAKPPTNVTACTIPLDFLYAFEDGYPGRTFRFRVHVDTNDQLCDGTEHKLFRL